MTTATFLGVHAFRDVAQALVNGVINGSGYALLGIAWGFIYGIARRFHFALSLTYTLAAYVASVLAAGSGIPVVPAILIGLAAAMIAGMLIELVYQGLVARIGVAALLPIFVVSMGITIAGLSAIQLIWGVESRTLAPFTSHNFTIGSVSFNS